MCKERLHCRERHFVRRNPVEPSFARLPSVHAVAADALARCRSEVASAGALAFVRALPAPAANAADVTLLGDENSFRAEQRGDGLEQIRRSGDDLRLDGLELHHFRGDALY